MSLNKENKKNGIWDKRDYQFILDATTDGNNIVRERKELDMDSWLTFYGIWIAEGWCDKHSESKNIYKVIISVNKQRVKDYLYPALEKLGFSIKKMQPIVDKIIYENENFSVEEVIKVALKTI